MHKHRCCLHAIVRVCFSCIGNKISHANVTTAFKTKIDLNRENKQFEKTETELSQLDR